jgi:hypothetical protein
MAGGDGSRAALAERAARRPVLGACASCIHRLHGTPINLGVGDPRSSVGGRWQQPSLHLREVRVVLAVLAERYGLRVVDAIGLWRGGY